MPTRTWARGLTGEYKIVSRMPLKKLRYKPRVIMSIHGYVSRGKWQKNLTECIKDNGLISAPYNYGYKLFRILPHHIRKDVTEFRDWYFSIVKDITYNLTISEPFHRPSIIAHSLGTWILVKALSKYPEMKFDKIFLHGSIVPSTFDWFKLILGDQVSCVVYEKAAKDHIAPLGLIFTGSFRPCGRQGFIQKSSFIKEDSFSLFGHSDFNYKAHFQEFIIRRLHETPHQLASNSSRKKLRRITRETDFYGIEKYRFKSLSTRIQ